MRLNLQLTPNKDIVPYDHLPALVGAIHKWLGQDNDMHGKPSLYSFSWLQGGKSLTNGLDFSNGSSFFISIYDQEVAQMVMKNILRDPDLNWGMRVKELQFSYAPDFGSNYRFKCASPFLIKSREKQPRQYLNIDDPNTPDSLCHVIHRKMEEAGLPKDDTLEINPTKEYVKHKLVNYKGIKNRVYLCPIEINGRPDTLQFIWEVGIGHSTGIGLGAIY